MKLVVQNSFCRIDGEISTDAEALLRQVMTYKNDIESERGQLFYQLKLSKRYNNKKQYFAVLSKIKHLESIETVCLYKDKIFPTGLLNIALECLNTINYPYEYQDLRQAPGATAILRWRNVPWTPRYYQKEMFDIGLKSGRGVFESAVGSGKSLVMAYLIKELSNISLIVVPSRGLSGQIYNDFSNWFGSQNVQLLDAKKIRNLKKPKPINIVTIQSLGSLKKTGEFKDFIKMIDSIYLDEIHHAGAATYSSLLEDMDHVYYRYGFTGTFLRNDNKTLEMWSFLSNVLYYYPPWKATEEGYLTPMEVYVHKMDGIANNKYQTEYDNCFCGNPALLERVHIICNNASSDQQILILVNKKEKSGLIVHEYLNSLNIENSYISGDNDKDEINQTIEAFNNKEIKILIGSAVIAEGIDIRSTDHLINLKGGKSEIVLVQALGRAVRLYPGKETAKVHEFDFENTNYMHKHFENRMQSINTNFKPKLVQYYE